MFQRRIERAGAERQSRQIGQHVEAGVIPGGIAYRQIDAAIALRGEVAAIAALAGSGIEHARAGGEVPREGRHGILQSRLEVQDVAPQKPGKAVCRRGVSHRGRASSMTVEPARQAASRAVGASAAQTRAK